MTCKTKVEGANLYLTLVEGDTVVLTMGELKSHITYVEKDGAKRIRVAVGAPKEVKIDRRTAKMHRYYT